MSVKNFSRDVIICIAERGYKFDHHQQICILLRICRKADEVLLLALAALAALAKTKLDLNLQNRNGNNILHWAVSAGLLKIVNIILDRVCDINHQNKWGNTPLHDAVIKRNYEMVALLLNRDADPNIANKKLETPLYIACKKGDLAISTLLLLYGANVNGHRRIVPLHACLNNIDCINLLFSHGANVNFFNTKGDTALHLSNNSVVTKILLSHGADRTIKNYEGKVPNDLHILS
jgi:ankyrin repeat protein